jgi:nicotinamidase-related amidase
MIHPSSGQRVATVPQLARAALLIIDVQKAIDADYHALEGPRNNPGAEQNIARLLAAWRREQRPIIHIRHDSTFLASAYRPGQEGNEFKNEVAPAAGETIVPKQTNCAFIGTGLERQLRDSGVDRMAGNLGFKTVLVADACFTFARRDFHGRLRTADEVHSMSLANLDGEYCTVLDTVAVLAEG